MKLPNTAFIKTKETNLHWPTAELVALPLAAAATAICFGYVLIRSTSMLTGLELGVGSYSVIVAAGIIGAFGTVASGVLNLPVSVRGAELFLLICLCGIGLWYDASLEPGSFVLRDITHSVQAAELVPTAVAAVWLLVSYLSTLARYVCPPIVPKPKDTELALRLTEEQFDHEFRVRSNAERALALVWRRVYDFMGVLFVVILLIAILGRSTTIASDGLLAWAGAGIGVGLLIYIAIILLSAKRRLAELETLACVPTQYGLVWTQGALLPALVAVLCAMLLPANLQLLFRFNIQGQLDKSGSVWYRFIRPTSYPTMQSTGTLPPAVGFGGVGALAIPMAYVVAWVVIAVFIYWVYLWVHNERLKARNVWRILLALVLWPFRNLILWPLQALVTFIRYVWRYGVRKYAAIVKARANVGSRATIRPLRAKKQLHPSNIALFVRYMYTRMLEAAGRYGIERYAQETAIEFTARLISSVPETEMSAKEMTSVYCSTRYAAVDPPEPIRARLLLLLRKIVTALRLKTRHKRKAASY